MLLFFKLCAIILSAKICPFDDSKRFLSENKLQLTPSTIYKDHFCEINSQFEVSFSNDPGSSAQVTRIPDNLFHRCHISFIIFSKYIKKIGFSSFSECTIDKIKFPEDSQMTTISNYAFYSTIFVQPFKLPETIEIIGKSAFQKSGIQNINFKNIVIIGKNSFQGCSKLTGPLEFPNTLEFLHINP